VQNLPTILIKECIKYDPEETGFITQKQLCRAIIEADVGLSSFQVRRTHTHTYIHTLTHTQTRMHACTYVTYALGLRSPSLPERIIVTRFKHTHTHTHTQGWWSGEQKLKKNTFFIDLVIQRSFL
jgi:hypothetical protein